MSRNYVQINSATPQHNAENVPLNQVIELVFSELMNKYTVTDSTKITLYEGSKKVAADYNYVKDISGAILYIKPKKDLKPGTSYRLRVLSGENGPVSGALLDIGKQRKIKSDHIYTFTTIEEKEVPPIEEEIPPVTEGDKEPETGPVEGEKPLPDKVPTEPEDDSGVIYDPLEGELNSFYLEESFPETGDLVDLEPQMVMVFNKEVNAERLSKGIFLKEAKINSLLEKINSDKLIKGSIMTEDKLDEAKELIFKPGQILEPGKEYQLVIKKSIHDDMSNDIRINFQTLFERMFADVDTVRLVLGGFADRLTDLDLAKLINQQSNSIYQLASMMDSFNELDWVQENGVILTFPYAASQYVVYSTAYYAILGRSLEGSSGMSESIRLADLSVSASSESSDNLSDLLGLLKAEFERWWNVLQGKPEEIEPGIPNPNYTMTIATRGGDEDPYPDFQTRVPFNELGGRDS